MENEKNGVLTNISNKMGGVEQEININYMTTYPKKYKMLNNKNAVPLIEKIKATETEMNKKTISIIPNNKIKSALQVSSDNFSDSYSISDGDIIAISTSVKGLDYAHIGFAFDRKLLHASSLKSAVIVDSNIAQ